jgi:membrane protein DedA with SNARE-associated domain
MSPLACIGLFAAVLGINEVAPRPFIAGSVLSGLMWTLTIGLGAFFVGPSLISLYDDAGKWAALVGGGSVALFIFMRRART